MCSLAPLSPTSPSTFQTSHSRWLALTHRIPSSHSSFLYGVLSTKIYCRPTCSARIARRANVIFYDTQDQARHDGFRPCKRCKPDDASFFGEGEEVVSRTLGLLRIKKGGVAMKTGLEELAKEVGVTRSYLCRVFKKKMGVTIGAYMKEFEREAGEGETERSVESVDKVGSGMVDMKLGLQTPATTAGSPSASVIGCDRGPAEEGMGDVEETFDLDFDFDEWFWTKDFSNEPMIDLYPD